MHPNSMVAAFFVAALCGAADAHAGSRLIATNGVTQIEGAAGGGLVPWALIAGLETRDEIGGSAFCTLVEPQDFSLRSCGLALGFSDRVELSVARQSFDLGELAPGESLQMDIVGVKVRLLGDAIFDARRWLPQISVGLQYKRSLDFDRLPALLGAVDDDGVDVYVAATKVFLDGPAGRTLLLNATLRTTKSNQLGLLGFGGDRQDSYTLQPELSAAVFLTDAVAIGMEYRFKPDNLKALEEDDFADALLTWFPHKSIALVLAYANLGTVAGKDSQRGIYGSLQLSF